jgi:hypothetical protein
MIVFLYIVLASISQAMLRDSSPNTRFETIQHHMHNQNNAISLNGGSIQIKGGSVVFDFPVKGKYFFDIDAREVKFQEKFDAQSIHIETESLLFDGQGYLASTKQVNWHKASNDEKLEIQKNNLEKKIITEELKIKAKDIHLSGYFGIDGTEVNIGSENLFGNPNLTQNRLIIVSENERPHDFCNTDSVSLTTLRKNLKNNRERHNSSDSTESSEGGSFLKKKKSIHHQG